MTAINTDTSLLPLRFIALFELLLSVTVLVKVVPLAVYVPVPISNASLPSSITYLTTSPSDTPDAANVW